MPLLGAPIYPEGQRPRAPCPVCLAEKGDTSQRCLYEVHGTDSGEYHSHIPASYFQIPPVRLDSSGPDTDAMRVSISIAI